MTMSRHSQLREETNIMKQTKNLGVSRYVSLLQEKAKVVDTEINVRLSRVLFYFFLRPSVVLLEVPSVSIQLVNPLNKPFPKHYLVVSGRWICRKTRRPIQLSRACCPRANPT